METTPTPNPPQPPKVSPSPRLSMRQGAIALRGIARFIHCIRNRQPISGEAAGTKTGKGKGKRTRRMGEKETYKCSPKLMEKLRKETLFTRNEIEALYKIYKKLVTFNKSTSKSTKSASSIITTGTTVSEGIDRTVFREVLHNTFDIITENMLMDRIFCVWDKINCGLICLENWFQGMSLFLKGNTAKQIDYCFAVYDLNSDGFITKDEMFQLLKNCLIKFPQEEDPEESVRDLVDIVMKKMDKDKDGKVCLEDYRETVSGEPLLLEAFGRCLPTEGSKITFLTTLRF
ncbi:EF-hand calcium-binding domain-containing protein 1-like [Sitophilus oryzae]|uniref:EF-hand calcium-binding domain-containing protein 1-like n=1 Tax=Sitophilus oryzae TaxID=7048 RepID=A0A6J2XJW2_SITOR|nr:EF-hand calcium-binding domain-containing protein 1-like [Sitophilus oryzae]